jgi:hypothetical protein
MIPAENMFWLLMDLAPVGEDKALHQQAFHYGQCYSLLTDYIGQT